MNLHRACPRIKVKMSIMKDEGEAMWTLMPLKDSSLTHYRLLVVSVTENSVFFNQTSSVLSQQGRPAGVASQIQMPATKIKGYNGNFPHFALSSVDPMFRSPKPVYLQAGRTSSYNVLTTSK